MLCAPVGSLQTFEPGGGATVAVATGEFGNGMILSSVSEPGLDKTAEAAPDGFRIFQLYVRGDSAWVDDHVRRAIDKGYAAFCLTVDTDSYSRRERDIAKRHQRRRVRVDDARIYQAQFNWRDIERIKKNFDIPLIIKGIATHEDAKIAVEHGVDAVYVSNHGGRQLDQGVGSIEVLPEVVEAVGGRARVMVDGSITRADTDVVKALTLGADAVVVPAGSMSTGLPPPAGRGVVRLFEILEDEIRICLSLLGVTRYSELDKSYIRAAPQVVPPHVHSPFPHPRPPERDLLGRTSIRLDRQCPAPHPRPSPRRRGRGRDSGGKVAGG